MNLFVDYIQPLTDWLQANPHWALFFTFLISLTESLAIIGSIIPGSITMTAIGIMAGSGIMRIDLTFLAAIFGSVTGDGLSYAIGYFYSDQLADRWPFSRYPSWFKYGRDFFEKHGGKSVFLGRFIGPLRSIIPVIAGIMHMAHWRFFLANFFSAIGWSILYITPGVLIGAASHELSAERATRLILLIFSLFVGVWFISLVIKRVLIIINSYLKANLHSFWLSLKNHRILYGFVSTITPVNEENHHPTVSLLLLTLFNTLCFIVIIIFTVEGQKIASLNIPAHLFISSFHTKTLEIFFIICSQLTSKLTISALFLTSCLFFMYKKRFKPIIYSSLLIIFSFLIPLTLSHLIDVPRPKGLLVIMPGSSFLSTNLVVATAFYGFLVFLLNVHYSINTNLVRKFIFILLGLNGLAALYLGDYWFTDIAASFFCGAMIDLTFCLIYRKSYCEQEKTTNTTAFLCTLFAVLLVFTAVSTRINLKVLVHNHEPYHKEYTIDKAAWWNQLEPILPLYRYNRIGKRISLLNIQFSGSLALLEKNLATGGWVSRNETLFTNLLARMNNGSNEAKLPILSQLYENKRAELMMVYDDPKSNSIVELRIWPSDYYLSNEKKPIWIGSIHINRPSKKHSGPIKSGGLNSMNTLTYILPLLKNFTVRRIEIPHNQIKKTELPSEPFILIIQ